MGSREESGGAMKTYSIVGRFPDVLVKHSMQEVRVKAATPAVAIARGVRLLLKADGIKGKRHKRFTLSVALVETERKEEA